MKLNVIDSDGNHLIPQRARGETEFHYLRFECYCNTVRFDLSALKSFVVDKLFRREKSATINECHYELKDWTLVDIDFALEGNMPIA